MSWESKPLGSVCMKIGSGVTPKGGDAVYTDHGTSLIRSQNVHNAKFQRDGLAFVNDDIAKKMAGVTVAENDVLLNITGDSVARCCLAPSDVLPARVNQHVLIIRPDAAKLNPVFLAKYLVSPVMQATLLSWAGNGGTRKALTKGMIEALEVPLPDFPTQQRIAGILSAYDDLIENNRRRIELLEQAARLLYREWFVHLRFPGHETAKIVDGLPEGWEKTTLGKHCPLIYGKALKAETRVDGPFDVYGSSGIVGTHNKALTTGPAIIVGRKGNVGSVYWARRGFWPIDTVYFVDPANSDFFTYFALQNIVFQNTDVAVPGLNRDYAHTREIKLPPKELVQSFNDRATVFLRQAELLSSQNDALTRARDLLLPRLMDGRIPV